MKRVLSLILIFALAISVAPSSFAVTKAPYTKFSELKGFWYSNEDVLQITDKEVITYHIDLKNKKIVEWFSIQIPSKVTYDKANPFSASLKTTKEYDYKTKKNGDFKQTSTFSSTTKNAFTLFISSEEGYRGNDYTFIHKDKAKVIPTLQALETKKATYEKENWFYNEFEPIIGKTFISEPDENNLNYYLSFSKTDVTISQTGKEAILKISNPVYQYKKLPNGDLQVTLLDSKKQLIFGVILSDKDTILGTLGKIAEKVPYQGPYTKN